MVLLPFFYPLLHSITFVEFISGPLPVVWTAIFPEDTQCHYQLVIFQLPICRKTVLAYLQSTAVVADNFQVRQVGTECYSGRAIGSVSPGTTLGDLYQRTQMSAGQRVLLRKERGLSTSVLSYVKGAVGSRIRCLDLCTCY